MDENFDIFGNFDEMCNGNLQGQIKKTIQNAKKDDSQSSVPELFDSDEELQNGTKDNEKGKKKKNHECSPPKKARSKSRSVSPVTQIMEETAKKMAAKPKRGRHSRGAAAAAETSSVSNENDSVAGSSRGRGKGRGRGRGRGGSTSTRSTRSQGIEPESGPSLTDMLNSSAAAALNLLQSLTRAIQTSETNNERSRRTVMRARREYLAEHAARAANVDYVDLVTSPAPRVTGFVSLDSDDESSGTPIVFNNPKPRENLETSFDEENPEINVKIKWDSDIETITLRKYQKFSHIFNILAEKKKVPVDRIVLNLDNKILTAEDTVAGINYKVYQFIGGRVLESFREPAASTSKATRSEKNRDLIKLKIQSDKWKRPLPISISKTEKFKILYIKCSEELNEPLDKLKLSFDGELLELDATPSDLELEGGEVIDLRFKN